MKTKAMPRITEPSDSDHAMELLLWARRERIVVSEVAVGSVRLVVNADIALAEALRPNKRPGTMATIDSDDSEAVANLYRQFGGPALEAMTRAQVEADGEDDGPLEVIEDD